MVIYSYPKSIGAYLELSQRNLERVHPMCAHIRGVNDDALSQLQKVLLVGGHFRAQAR